VPRPDQPLDEANGVQGAALRAIGVLLRLQVGLEDRLQDERDSRLYDTISDARNAQRPLLAIPIGDVHAPHRLALIRSLSEFFRQFVQALVPSHFSMSSKPCPSTPVATLFRHRT
jgi:hypothetical protein